MFLLKWERVHVYHILCMSRGLMRSLEPSRACSNCICRQNSSSQMRPTLAFRQESAALVVHNLSDSLPISPSQQSFCGNNYMSLKLHNLLNTSLQKCFLKNFTSTSEAPNNCNKHINLTDAEQEIPITPWKLGNFTWCFYQAAWHRSTLTSLKKHKKWQLSELGQRIAAFQAGRCARLRRRQKKLRKLMDLPCEFEQAVKYVMSVWPGSRSENKSETVFCLHAHIKKITQWK